MKTPRIQDLLKYRRPARSSTEEEFIHRYLDSIPGMTVDRYSNRMLLCADARTMISVHTDTVHRLAGKQRIRQVGNVLTVDPTELLSNCLGADDSAGIYAALRMIQAGVKASFVFHRDEEIGGRGSAWLAQNYAPWLGTFERCIALDRRGTRDVITHQAFGRCCSDEFAAGLSDALGMDHVLCPHGIFTDSANYVGIIPECTNLSVGYESEHTSRESLDLDYLERLIERLVAVRWDELAVSPWTDEHGFVGETGDYCEYCDECTEELLETPERLLVCADCYRWFEEDKEQEREMSAGGPVQ